MRDLTPENIPSYEVENYVHLLVDQRLSVEYLKRHINNLPPEDEIRDLAKQRVDFAMERINKSLTTIEVLSFLFLPFGKINKFKESTLFDIVEEKRMGYVNRVKQFYLVSILGIMMYLILITLFFKIQ